MLGSGLETGMAKEQALRVSSVKITVSQPILFPGESVSLLLGGLSWQGGENVFAEAGKAFWFGSYEDHAGIVTEGRDYLDLRLWLEAVLMGRQWPDELQDADTNLLSLYSKTFSQKLLQQVEEIRSLTSSK